MLSSKNIIAQFSAMTTCSIQVDNAHGYTQNTNGLGTLVTYVTHVQRADTQSSPEVPVFHW